MYKEQEVPSQRLCGMTFGTYTSEEIKKLSVKELTNPQSFDTLLHPTVGGLYDPELGPNDRDDLCGTCGQNSMHCPGHMGHISLPLPVFNPVFFRHLVQILRGSCLSCHRLLVRRSATSLFICQVKALNSGLIETSDALQCIVNNIVCVNGTDMGFEAEIEQKLKDCLKRDLEGIGNSDPECCDSLQVKHLVELKQNIVKSFIDSFPKGRGGKCVHCKKPFLPLRTEHNSKIFFQKGVSQQKYRQLLEKKKREKEMQEKKKQLDMEFEDTVMEDSGKDLNQTLEKDIENLTDQTYLTPLEARQHMKELWCNEEEGLKALYSVLNLNPSGCSPVDIFFLDVIPVPPSRFRPISVLGDKRFENAQTTNIANVLKSAITVRQILSEAKSKDNQENQIGNAVEENENEKSILDSVPGKSFNEKLQNAWVQMQVKVNGVIDSDLDKLNKDKQPGVKQLLEKKEGLFRKHMMGKRVNYAARSVISPDPYINVDEIGIPYVFAKKLTYPQPVTHWNVKELRQAVINGPHVHPGACFVENEDGYKVMLSPHDQTQREAIAKQLLTPSTTRGVMGPKVVYRHLKNGDVLLLNRQPTLHRPSIQAHKARVLPGEKTLRLHYANCKAYNADFDGDEMNAHFVQGELARAEAYTLASTPTQYLVPKDGTPLAGLIQDHMVSGVRLTVRGRFFNRNDYQQLVFNALTDKYGAVKLLPPSIIKPEKLWSGKQVVSTVLLNLIPEGKEPLNLKGKSKIAAKNWQTGRSRAWLAGELFGQLSDDFMSESEVIIRQGELLCGVLDKAHYGSTPYSLVHCCYELYGGATASSLLTALAKLFTTHLQYCGFTLGVEDILVKPGANASRKKAMEDCRSCGPHVAAKAFDIEDPDDVSSINHKFEAAHYSADDTEMKELDLCMKGATDQYQNQISKACMPNGLHKRFPDNNLQLMVQSGAKGSMVNCMQISCLLGQIELEGRRPPLMMNGRSLPSFLQNDTSPRAGGFIDGRFLTGIRPQEYFFHCMAGREGLVDTAVKTSRSGYLQRCIIKHLEGLTVGYDMTVRDSDGSIVQFHYGEDGLDIMKTQFLNQKQFPFMVENEKVMLNQDQLKKIEAVMDTSSAKKVHKKIQKWKKKNAGKQHSRQSAFLDLCSKQWDDICSEHSASEMGNTGRSMAASQMCRTWFELDAEKKKKMFKRSKKQSTCPSPVPSQLSPSRYFGSLPEKLQETVDSYMKADPDKILIDEDNDVKPGKISKDRMQTLMNLRGMLSLIDPGEAVGLLAAQSIGEPSTQMTLNTFHFAGRGEMNVTLGIPRLREILMVASANIKTPQMDIPLLEGDKVRQKAKQLQLKLTKVYLSQVLEEVEVCEFLSVKNRSDKSRMYRVAFHFLPADNYSDKYALNPGKVLHFMERRFIDQLISAVKRKITDIADAQLINSATTRERVQRPAANAPNSQEDDISDDDLNDGDAAADKLRERQQQERDYQGEEEEREELGEEEEESDVEIDEMSAIAEPGSDEDMEGPSRSSTPDEMLPKKKKDKKKKRKSVAQMDATRIHAVINSSDKVAEYRYDADNQEWCEITIKLGLMNSKFDMTSLIETEAKKAIVHQTPGISRAFISDSKRPGEASRMKMEGVNIIEMFKHDRILDLNKLYSNDIHAIANMYGIEAAVRVIIKEIRDVFAAYGIQVDYRHLSLVADYMTFEGVYKPFNRVGMESNASPLQKMSFETTMHFLKTATISGMRDDLKSPSARIVVGKVVGGGTGAFELKQPLF